MSRSRIFLIALCLALSAQAQAQPAEKQFPAEFRGLWFSGKSCEEADRFVLFGPSFGLVGALKPQAEGKFALTTFAADIVVEAKPDRLTVTRAEGGDKKPLVREIKNGTMATYPQDAPDKKFDSRHCANPGARDPQAQPLLRLLRRVEILARNYADVADACRDPAKLEPCAAALIKVLDVNGDGKISPAELTTFLRHNAPLTGFMGGAEKEGKGYKSVTVDTEDLSGIEAAMTAFGPFITNVIFSNADFDGNGFLTADELVLVLKEENLGGGIDTAKLLSDSRKHAEDAFTAAGGLSQMLGGPNAPKPDTGAAPEVKPDAPPNDGAPRIPQPKSLPGKE